MATLLKFPRGIRPKPRKDGTTGYLVQVVGLDGTRRAATVDTMEQALAKYEELKGQGQGNRPRRAPEVWTIGRAFERAQTLPAPDGWKGANAERTLVCYAQQAVTFFGPTTRMDELRKDDLDAYASYLEEQGNAPATVNRKMSAVSKLMRIAMDRGGMEHRPNLPRRREGAGREGFLKEGGEELFAEIFRKWERPLYADVTYFLVDTGLRCGEFWKLRPSDIEQHGGQWRVVVRGENAKNRNARAVPLTGRARAAAVRMLAEAERTDSYWVAPGSYQQFYRVWTRAKDALGYGDNPNMVPHILRHTCASRLLQRGAGLRQVQEWMGHKTITVTMRYAKLAVNALVDVVGLLERDAKEPEVA